jgi:hypothetical protein
MVKAPRIDAGEFSAARMGTVEPFAPMPKRIISGGDVSTVQRIY